MHLEEGGLSVQDTRASDGRTNMLRYLAKRLVSEEPPHAVLSTQAPHVLSAPLKTSLMVDTSHLGSPSALCSAGSKGLYVLLVLPASANNAAAS